MVDFLCFIVLLINLQKFITNKIEQNKHQKNALVPLDRVMQKGRVYLSVVKVSIPFFKSWCFIYL